MKKNVLTAGVSVLVCLSPLPIQAVTVFWDGGAEDGLWCSPTNWGDQGTGDTNYNTVPTSSDTVLFRNGSPAGDVQFTCDTNVARIRLTSSLYPKTLGIGTNEVGDRTVTLTGAAAELLDLTATVAGRDLTLSGATNAGGYKLKVEFGGAKPINVASVNASLIVSCDIFGAGGFDKTGAGALILSGSNTYSGATTISGGSVMVNSPGSLSTATTVTVNSGGTLGGNGLVKCPVTVLAGGALAPGASVGTLTLESDLTLSGNLSIEVNKSLSPSNDVIYVAGALTNAGTGTVTVNNLGPALAIGDVFQIFNKPLTNGEAMTVVSPTGAGWTNKLAYDGTIEVVSLPAMDPATILSIVQVSPTNYNLGGLGVASVPYRVFAATNITLPQSNWWLLGTTNSSAGGVIQFLDTKATNDQRFYRVGQIVP